jgi:hypothetical protein
MWHLTWRKPFPCHFGPGRAGLGPSFQAEGILLAAKPTIGEEIVWALHRKGRMVLN